MKKKLKSFGKSINSSKRGCGLSSHYSRILNNHSTSFPSFVGQIHILLVIFTKISWFTSVSLVHLQQQCFKNTWMTNMYSTDLYFFWFLPVFSDDHLPVSFTVRHYIRQGCHSFIHHTILLGVQQSTHGANSTQFHKLVLKTIKVSQLLTRGYIV